MDMFGHSAPMTAPHKLRPVGRAAAVFLALLCLSTHVPGAAPPEMRPARVVLHINGIAGRLPLDDALLRGLRDGGVEAEFLIHDWTGADAGIPALRNGARHREQAGRIAELISGRLARNPRTLLTITCHSGGAGLAVWALERLPDDLQVEDVFMFAPALSPAYDLSAALARVRGRMLVFSSPYDSVILDVGTRLFGTIDGVKSVAAGLNGFVMPAGADAVLYRKLVPVPYKPHWLLEYGNAGSHICAMGPLFARHVVARLMLGETLEQIEKGPASRAAIASDPVPSFSKP